MATIGKLMLFGIRSFGPNDNDIQKVKFESPLTLFLGENGCGKTTIIEALKFACSGDVPGGSRSGQGFVNDPKLNNRQSTKGQVRLSIVDAKGNHYIIIKSVQVQNKANSSSFKRLDSTLKRVNPENENATTISSRCSDIDTDICEILGVSKAILNNVIFCHQEDAAWPLDEPKKLKEKFDEIFGATEYNKCAENIRKLIKEKETDNKVKASKVVILKQNKDIVDKKNSDLNEKRERLSNFEANIQVLKDKLIPINTRLNEICDLENNIAQLQITCTKKETTRNALMEQQTSILKNITKEYEGSDQELQGEISLFETNRDKIKDKLKHLEEIKKKIETDQKQLSLVIDSTQIKLGKLEGIKKQYEDRIKERNELIENFASNLKIQVHPLQSNDNVLQAIHKISNSIDEAKHAYDDLVRECDHEESQLQDSVNCRRDELSKTVHNIESKNKQIRELQNKTRDVNSQLKELDYSDEQLKSLQSKISRIDLDLTNWKSSFDVTAITNSIENDKQKVRQLNEKLEILDKEHRILIQNSITDAELETQRHEVIKRESDIHKLKNKHYESLNTIFKDEIPNPGIIKKAIESYKQTNFNKVNDINRKIVMKQKECTTFETKTRFQNEKLQLLEKELQDNQDKVFEVCKGNQFDKECKELHETIERLQKEKGQYSSAKIMYEKFLNDFQNEKPCCPICQTGFSNQQNALKEIIRTIKSRIQGIPQELLKVEEQLKIKQKQYSKVLQLKPVNDKIGVLNSSLIPEAKVLKNNFDSSLKKVNDELKQLTDILMEPQVILDACNRIIGDAAVIDQNQFEIERSQKKIVELELQLIKVPSNRSRQHTEAEIQEVKAEQETARRNYEMSEVKLKQHNERCQELREERSKYVEKQLQLQKAMQGKPQLQDQLTELTNKEEMLISEIGDLQLLLEPLKLELKEAQDERDQVKLNNRKKLNEAQNKLHQNRKLFEDINKLQKHIQDYITLDGDGVLQAATNELKNLKIKNESLEQNKQRTIDTITEVNKDLANQDGGFRSLSDNWALREKRKQEQLLLKEINKLKSQIGSFNHRTLLEEKKKLREEDDSLTREINKCTGRNDELKEEIRKLTVELNSVENKRAHINYKKGVIELTVEKEAVTNLHLYLKALEIGVMRFHQERMNQINKIIRQLWRSIYRGNDCDYIEIKTDETKSTGLRRTYNYKVIQMKNDVEIDMRGRCSAGQKVLACLVIRMALAETFSKNCGILALDEPTTNLDRSNITSLSEALARIVTARQSEKNFQLLIITHDEEFLSALSRVDKVSYFWRVSRNNKGNSIITKEYKL